MNIKQCIKKIGLSKILLTVYDIIVNNLLSRILSDKQYLSFVYYLNFRKKINLNEPITFNEKLNWLKLHDHNPKYNIMADKYEVKKYVEEIIGSEYIVPCYGVWESFESIDFDLLPNSFVLKTTHDSSGVVICRNKIDFDFQAARKKIEKSFKRKYYLHTKEWVYQNITPRIIADKFLDDGSGRELRDYKFWCFNGEPKVMYITNKARKIYENFYDMDFNCLNISHGFDRMSPEFEMPNGFLKMKELAMKLSSGIPFVRVDFFDVNNHIYFGEFTFYDWAGLRPFLKIEDDIKLGDYINLPSLVDNDGQ